MADILTELSAAIQTQAERLGPLEELPLTPEQLAAIEAALTAEAVNREDVPLSLLALLDEGVLQGFIADPPGEPQPLASWQVWEL